MQEMDCRTVKSGPGHHHHDIESWSVSVTACGLPRSTLQLALFPLDELLLAANSQLQFQYISSLSNTWTPVESI